MSLTRKEWRLQTKVKWGPDILETVLDAVPSLPEKWIKLAPDEAFERLRCKLEMSQKEIGLRAGMSQARVSRIEGGLDRRLSEWKRVYRAMGFELALMPISRLDVEELVDHLRGTRPPGRHAPTPARPRRRWRLRRAANAQADMLLAPTKEAC